MKTEMTAWLIAAALLAPTLSGCGHSPVEGKSRADQLKAMQGGPIPPEVMAKIAASQRSGGVSAKSK